MKKILIFISILILMISFHNITFGSGFGGGGASGSSTLRSQQFLNSGVFTVPTGVTLVWVTAVGGGAGGGAGMNDASSNAGGGGGAGETIYRFPINLTGIAALNVTIGAAGNGGLTCLSGVNGEPTSVDHYVVSLGGKAGFGGGTAAANVGMGGAGGGPGANNGGIKSGSGNMGTVSLYQVGGSSGGGSNSVGGRAFNYAGGNLGVLNAPAHGGGGGASDIFGQGGGGGNGNNLLAAKAGANAPGNSGAGGGGGGSSGGVSECTNGGNGGQGRVIVEWVQ